MIIYLGSQLLTTSSDSPRERGTVLHRCKDLAVSPACCHAIIPNGIPNLSVTDVSARTSKRCFDGNYPLHAAFLRAYVRTFLCTLADTAIIELFYYTIFLI
jgi:hypothetical protein